MGALRRLVVPILLAALGGCASPSPGPLLPFAIGNGKGSQHGTYATVETGETLPGPDGSSCPVYEWDRPLNGASAIRYRSASCPLPGQPGRFHSFNLDRAVIPLAHSRVPGLVAETARARRNLPPTDGRAAPTYPVTAAPLR